MGSFIQNEILGMAWLERLIGSLLTLCGLDTDSKIGGSVLFFIYDTIKIMLLLGVLILIISYIQSYFPPERSKKLLGRFNGLGARIIAALLGTVTPFCSCSSIPLFIGFTSAGLPLGVTFSFRCGRHADREAAPRGSGSGVYPKREGDRYSAGGASFFRQAKIRVGRGALNR